MSRHTAGCPQSWRIQDLLEGVLSHEESQTLRAHLADCRECTEEAITWRRLMRAMASVPIEDPGPGFTDRVLSLVVPARVRRRWIRTAGWAYAGSLAASVAVVSTVLAMPGTRLWIEGAGSALSRQLVQSAVMGLKLVEFAAIGFTHGTEALNAVGERIVPLGRPFAALLAHPPVELAFAAAGVVAAGVILWLHGRGRTGSRGIDPLGLLGM